MKINKGLAVHIIGTFIFFITVLYVYDGLPTKKEVVAIFFFVNFTVVNVCYKLDWYEEELN